MEGNVGEGISGKHSLVPFVSLLRAEPGKCEKRGFACLQVLTCCLGQCRILQASIQSQVRKYILEFRGGWILFCFFFSYLEDSQKRSYEIHGIQGGQSRLN